MGTSIRYFLRPPRAVESFSADAVPVSFGSPGVSTQCGPASAARSAGFTGWIVEFVESLDAMTRRRS